jgi:uncharacterized protein YjdB
MRTAALLLFGVAIVSIACSDASKGTTAYTSTGPRQIPQTVSSLVLTPSRLSVVRGGSSQFRATAKDALGNQISDAAISWRSSDTLIASVTSAGVVRAVNLGTASITAAADQTEASANVTVTQVSVASLAVSLNQSSISVGASTLANAVVRDSTGAVLTDRVVTWASSAPTIASVSADGLVTGIAGGSATISATSEGVVGQAGVVVAATPAPVASVTVSLALSSVTVGQTTQASAVLKDGSGNVLSGRTISWSSSSPSVATVSSAGVVTAMSVGSSNIVATSEGITGQATISIVASAPPPVASVSVSLGAGSLMIGQATQATAVLKDASGNVLTGRTTTWGSSNPAVATVSSAGLVTAVAAGTAVITGTSEAQSGSATLTVNVVPVASVAVSLGASSLTVGQTTQGTAVLKDASGTVLTGRTITWASANTAVATVSATGLVTAVGAGSAGITASSEGQSGTAIVTVSASTPPPPGTWANEPAGFRTWSDVNWSSLTPTGWSWSFGQGGNGTLTTDATAPISPASVLQIKFPQGFTGSGTEPAKVVLDDPGSAARPTELFVGFAIKVSNPWQGHSSGVNKILFLDTGSGSDALVVEMFGTQAPYHLRFAAFELGATENRSWLDQNVTNPEFTLGLWHTVEIYCKYGTSSTSYDGIVKAWFDGVLVMNYTDINFADNGFGEQQLSPTWGGTDNTQTKTENDYYWIDDLHFSRR